jgi:hypothetical protein
MIETIFIALLVALAIGVTLAVLLNLLDSLFADKKSNSIIKFLKAI